MRFNHHTKQQIIAELLRARRHDLANAIAHLVVARMTHDEALRILGVQPGADADAIKKAYRQAALKNHPDTGGDEEAMKAVNEAYDTLSGGGAAQPTSPWYEPTYKSQPREKPAPVRISFEDAMRSAHVPTADVRWRFITSPGYGGYGDNSYRGYVVYGKDEHHHVFVAVFHRSERNAFTGTDLETYTMWTIREPLTKPLASVAPSTIRALWSNFEGCKGYNAKVALFKEPVEHFKQIEREALKTATRYIAFKDAAQQLGETVPDAWTSKLDIIFEVTDDGGLSKKPLIRLIVNGKEYDLSENLSRFILKTGQFMRLVFGAAYYYSGSKKTLTKMQKQKAILEWLVKNLEAAHEPNDLIEAVKAAAAKAKA